MMVAPSRVGPPVDADPLVLNADRDVVRWPARSTVPDLSDPDTRAAYDRRLALALGCPEEHADVGIRFRPSRDVPGGWHLEAGFDDGDFYDGHVWMAAFRGGGSDPLLARALARPADKRVRL